MTHPNTSNLDGAVSDERLAEMLETCEGAGDVGIADWQYKEASVTFGTMRSILTELQSRRRSPSAIEVKGLGPWRLGYCDDQVTIEQVSFGGLYQVRVLNGVINLDWPDPRLPSSVFGTVEEAKAAAEADYRQRILSTLSLPQHEGEREAVAWPDHASPLPWTYHREKSGRIIGHRDWIEDAYGGVVVENVGHIDGPAICAAVNAAHPPELTIDEAVVESVLSWVRDDVLPAYGITHSTRATDPEMVEGARAALTAAFKGGEQ